jgi:hypothetical protein
MRPVDAISHAAATILGCSVRTAARYVRTGRLMSHGAHPSLSLVEVEQLACAGRGPRRRRWDVDGSTGR